MKITKTASGKWTTLIAIEGIDGKRHFKRFTHKNKNTVRELASDYLTEHSVYMESMAFGDAMCRLLDRKAPILKPSTMRGYRTDERMLLKDYEAFCRTSIDRITSEQIQAVIEDMKLKGKSPKTIKNRVGLISEVIRSEGLRMPHVTMPKVVEPELHVPDDKDISKVAAAAAGTRMEVPLALAVFGMRRGEICAVRDTDLDGTVLHVRRGISVDPDGYDIETDTPKNTQSIRQILLPDHIADLIRAQGRAWCGTVAALSSAWPHLCDRAGVERFRLHDCRHFFVSYCHEALGLSDAQIMKLGGWKTDYVMKKHYRHALSDASDTLLQNLGGIIAAKPQKQGIAGT